MGAGRGQGFPCSANGSSGEEQDVVVRSVCIKRLQAAEYAPLQEDLERHLFFLDRQLGRVHELLLYMVQAVPPR